MTHKGQLVRWASTFEKLAKRKKAGLKVRSAGQAIQCVVLRCNRYMKINVENYVFLITLRANCRGIR